MKWLIAPEALARASEQHEYLTSLATRSVAQVAADLGMDTEEVASAQADALLGPALRVQGGVATIAVRGVLLDGPSWLYDLFGIEYAHYEGIVDQLAAALEDPRVESVLLDVDSPGGLVRGVFQAADAIFAAAKEKPVHARVSGMAASAAYLLASQADTITATGRADEVGSIGVAVDMYVSPNAVSIASTDAPNKRPDVRTDTGRAVVRGELDAIHDLFVGAVVRGRGVSEADVREKFGRGGILLAGEAAKVWMIDAVENADGLGARSGGSLSGMDLDTLRVSHPETYEAAVAAGVQRERARVIEHLTLGEDNGAANVAAAAIRCGAGLDASVIVQYARVGAARDLVAARDAAAPEARGAAAAVDTASREETRMREIMAAAAAKLGQG